MRVSSYCAVAIALLFLRMPGAASAEVVAFVGATVHTVSDGLIERGTVVIDGPRIAAVGPVDDVPIPEDARQIDASGKVLIPGLVDTHSHVGVYPRPLVPAHRNDVR